VKDVPQGLKSVCENSGPREGRGYVRTYLFSSYKCGKRGACHDSSPTVRIKRIFFPLA
jgi:hypothetical protein